MANQKSNLTLPLQPRDYLVLFSMVDGPSHGHAILKAVEENLGGVVLDPSNLYRALRRFEQGGYIEDAGDDVGDGNPRGRRRYRLTGAGFELVAAEAQRIAGLAEEARRRDLLAEPKG